MSDLVIDDDNDVVDDVLVDEENDGHDVVDDVLIYVVDDHGKFIEKYQLLYIDNHINWKNVIDKLSCLPHQHCSLVQDGKLL